jgi:GNAT superfamily N-acetyltransferase
MPDPVISILDQPSDEDRRAIYNPLIEFNKTNIGADSFELVAIMLKDDVGQSIGGLWGELYYDWLFVELLFVPESLRGKGFGSKLLGEAERIAKTKGGTGIWLDTFSFQAPDFYEKHGYERFAALENYPRGKHRFFFRKIF